MEALLAAEPGDYLPVLALFDHEEVGSTSDHGAQSDFLLTTWNASLGGWGGDREDFLRLPTASMVASGDMAHATHPNYPGASRTRPPHLGQRRPGAQGAAQSALRHRRPDAAAFELACRQAACRCSATSTARICRCGSTIGPMTAARTGIPTVDVGAPQLAMHSARELDGAADGDGESAALQAFSGAAVSPQ